TLHKKSPYKGLKRFNFQDREYFFGRDALIYKLFTAVNKSSFSLVLGASGSGKSSVVRAGLIPEIKEYIEIYKRFYYFIFTPDRDPFESLYRCLKNEEKDYNFSISEAEIALKAKSGTLMEVINTLKKEDEYWFLFIDQFEQLFTICTDLEKRKNFIAGIVELAKKRESSVKIVLAMRSDFLEQFSFYPTLGAIANQNNIHLVTEMYPDELRRAIAQPAAKNGVVFEEGLIEQIIEEVERQKGYLPLLQYTLDLLWEKECKSIGADGCPHIEDRTLNKINYAALEGVRGALQKRVDEIYKDICEKNPEGELVTKQIFLKLVNIVEIDSESKFVSRRAYRNEFVGEPIESILKRFIDENLLVSSYEYSKAEKLLVGSRDDKYIEHATVEIAHEILLSSWEELKRWLEGEKEAIILKNWLAGETRKWLEVR
ncbi:MAG: ATP-binding protein, partial [Trichodesmium sp. St2_bin2_1]|nr:ATP-binding protein [Trichodesmium sp. St2_bin2_1]